MLKTWLEQVENMTKRKQGERASPTNIGITRGTPSVATLAVVSHEVDIRVALGVFHITCGVRNDREGVRIVNKKKNP